jgi:hypothetical protein
MLISGCAIDKTRKDDPNKLGPGTYNLNIDSVTKTHHAHKISSPVKVKNLKHRKEFIDDLVSVSIQNLSISL